MSDEAIITIELLLLSFTVCLLAYNMMGPATREKAAAKFKNIKKLKKPNRNLTIALSLVAVVITSLFLAPSNLVFKFPTFGENFNDTFYDPTQQCVAIDIDENGSAEVYNTEIVQMEDKSYSIMFTPNFLGFDIELFRTTGTIRRLDGEAFIQYKNLRGDPATMVWYDDRTSCMRDVVQQTRN